MEMRCTDNNTNSRPNAWTSGSTVDESIYVNPDHLLKWLQGRVVTDLSSFRPAAGSVADMLQPRTATVDTFTSNMAWIDDYCMTHAGSGTVPAGFAVGKG